MEPESIHLLYCFKLGDNEEKTFDIELAVPSYQLIHTAHRELPPWTELAFNQCSHCPFTSSRHRHCPNAVGLLDVIDFFKTSYSYAEADIIITTPLRTISNRVSLQKGISSLVGLIMASSGCPILSYLRPLVFVHLPFASLDETMYRVFSMYLLAQFLKSQKGGKPDWSMSELKTIYENVHKVNQNFTNRLRSLHIQDACLNALINLDCFAINGEFSIEEGDLDGIEKLFTVYTG